MGPMLDVRKLRTLVMFLRLEDAWRCASSTETLSSRSHQVVKDTAYVTVQTTVALEVMEE